MVRYGFRLTHPTSTSLFIEDCYGRDGGDRSPPDDGLD